MLAIETVAVLGTGPDAVGFALLCSLAGLEVRLGDADPAALDEAFRLLRRDVERGVADGRFGREERQRILDGILITSDLGEATVGADLVFAPDAVEPGAARRALAELSRGCRATALLATRHDPGLVGQELPQPGRVVGIELVPQDGHLPRPSLRTAASTTAHARARAEELLARLERAAGDHSSR